MNGPQYNLSIKKPEEHHKTLADCVFGSVCPDFTKSKTLIWTIVGDITEFNNPIGLENGSSGTILLSNKGGYEVITPKSGRMCGRESLKGFDFSGSDFLKLTITRWDDSYLWDLDLVFSF